jgi:hypothetical protein
MISMLPVAGGFFTLANRCVSRAVVRSLNEVVLIEGSSLWMVVLVRVFSWCCCSTRRASKHHAFLGTGSQLELFMDHYVPRCMRALQPTKCSKNRRNRILAYCRQGHNYLRSGGLRDSVAMGGIGWNKETWDYQRNE